MSEWASSPLNGVGLASDTPSSCWCYPLTCLPIVADQLVSPFACSIPRHCTESDRESGSVLYSSGAYQGTSLIQARYVGLMVIFFVGVFNLLKTFISGMGCIDDENYRNEAYRYGRHALRPWTEAEWKRSIGKDDFAPISPKAPQSDGQRLGTSRNRKKKKKREEKALSRTQRLQRRIGDRHWPNRRSPQLVKAYGEDGVPPHMLNEGEQYHEECVVISKTPAQRYAERGTINRG